MKFKHFGLVAMMVAICLICSCGGGSGSDSDNAQKVVALSFAVDTDDAQRSISSTSTDLLSTAKYQYKATANWTSEYGTPQGTKTEWTDFTVNASKVGNIGYFAVGSWTFHVRVLDSSKTITLYETTQNGVVEYVNTTITENNPISIPVSKVNEGKGTINFGDYLANGTYTLSAPACGDDEELIVTYGPVGEAAIGNPLSLTKLTTVNGFTGFKGQITNVNAGVYWVTITRNDGTADVGSSTTMVEIYSGKTETVKGTVQAGKWVETFIKIAGIKTIAGNISTNTNCVQKGTPVVFDISGAISEYGVETNDTVIYEFYVNGVKTTVVPDNQGQYSWATNNVAYEGLFC